MRSLKEVLVWRILSSHSLWVSWIKKYLIRKGSFWTIKENTLSGSWMWRKVLKCIAKSFYRIEVRDGVKASFWHEVWSPLGCLRDILGNGAHIDLVIPINANVDASRSHRRRHHRLPILNRVEIEIDKYKAKWKKEEDISIGNNEKGLLQEKVHY